ncbi:MAG: hypothetical protein NWE94_02625 [Candidatus Bathyarchaeota archaeon]|nr:hypothetical protein [Candidatus Bathyarchaeota archaeon]
MSLGWKDWSRSDILCGVIAPLIVVLVIIGLSFIGPFLMRQGGMGGSMGIVIGIISEIEEILIVVAIPLLLGLVWNRWAGGTSGFLLGSIYAMWWYVKYIPYAGSGGYSRGALGGFGPMLLGWVLTAMLIGYMAGALNRGSENFRRMVIVGVVSATVGGLLLFWLLQLSPSNVVDGLDGFLLTVLSRTAAGVIIPIIAKVFMWYGVAMNKKPDSGS